MTAKKPDNPLAKIKDGQLKSADAKQASRGLIYETVMKSGGEPFGAPFEAGVTTLTEKIVKLLKQSGFFGFETMEKLRRKNRRNKFTRHGAAPFLGDHAPRKK